MIDPVKLLKDMLRVGDKLTLTYCRNRHPAAGMERRVEVIRNDSVQVVYESPSYPDGKWEDHVRFPPPHLLRVATDKFSILDPMDEATVLLTYKVTREQALDVPQE